MSQRAQSNVPEKITLQKILRLHKAGGVLHDVPVYPTSAILEDTPEAQELAALWDNFNKAKQALDLKIEQLSETV